MNLIKYNFLQFIIDIFYILILFILYQKLNIEIEGVSNFSYLNYIILMVVLLTSWLIFSLYTNIYKLERYYSIINIIVPLFYQLLFFSMTIVVILGLLNVNLFSFRNLFSYLSTLLVVLLINRFIVFIYLKKIHQKGHNLIRVIIIDENLNTINYINSLNDRKDFGFIIDEIIFKSEIEEDYLFDTLKNRLSANDTIFYSSNGKFSTTFMNNISNLAHDLYCNLYIIPDHIYDNVGGIKVDYINHLPLINTNQHPLKDDFNKFIKRVFDFSFSFIISFIILFTIFPIIILLIKLDSKGPVFFQQKRQGLNGKEFICYKFRTMTFDGTNSLIATTINDNRVTKIGNFLRKSSLDELPQFLNVILGNMSIVGPRPHMISQDQYYSDIIKKYNLRNNVKPGITGLAQVKGYRGAIDCKRDMEDRVRMDIFYVRNWSVLLDIQIIYLTIILMIRGDDKAI